MGRNKYYGMINGFRYIRGACRINLVGRGCCKVILSRGDSLVNNRLEYVLIQLSIMYCGQRTDFGDETNLSFSRLRDYTHNHA
jgi:hypothetical protein